MSHDPSVDKVERLADLVAYLLDVAFPRSLREILAAVEGYPDAWESARAQFARDRDLLAGEGVEIMTLGSGEDARYRIDPATYYLPDLGLTEDEAVALNLVRHRCACPTRCISASPAAPPVRPAGTGRRLDRGA